MRALIGSWLLMSLGLMMLAEAEQPGLKMTVRVYNYAGVPAETLARAERASARIYERVGLAAEWLDCPLTAEEAERNTVCQLPGSPTPFNLRLLSNSMAKGLPLGRDIFGLALLPEEGGFGVTANVCAGRAQEMEDRNESLHGVILGHLMAHELGHLLLGTAAHPASGIMHIPWRTQELERVKQGVMLFLPEEAEKIRTQMVARGTSERARR